MATTFAQKMHLPKKYIPSAKTLCTEDLSNITFNYQCENFLCHFQNHKSFFTAQVLSIFLAQTLHTFPFSLLGLTFTKLLMSFYKQKVIFSSKFGSFFSVMRDNSYVPFQLKLYMLLTKLAHQSANFQTCHCLH